MTKRRIKNYLGRNFKKKRESDKITKEHRSVVMSKIRSRDTKFEEDFIRALKKRTRKTFERNVQLIKGKPDIVFKRAKLCVFLDSDFWHGWQYSRWKHLLKNDFWKTKIEKNRLRDKKTTLFLKRKGWIVVRLWEHLIKRDINIQVDKVIHALEKVIKNGKKEKNE
ncbi:MAG: very short patch repair endonuclease [Candidatus Omnitrophica bacterium]|nr:very short patch repair endonuclease [Candidatus Omnitrophota bacterium]